MNRAEEIRIMSLPKMQEKFREAMGEWRYGDGGYSDLHQAKGMYIGCTTHGLILLMDDKGYKFADIGSLTFRFPLPIDPVNPERGLWGMVDWSKWYKDIEDNGDLYLVEPVLSPTIQITATPTLALLKALAHQWNVEVEE